MALVTIGDMRQRVTFRSVTKTPDTSLGDAESYADWFSTWAKVEDGGGRRDFLSSADKVIDEKRIYVFYRADLITGLTKDTRILYNGQEYSIERYTIVDEVKRLVKFETSASR